MHARHNGIKQLLNLIKPKQNSILGMDINSAAVSLLEFSGDSQSLCLERYGKEALPPNVIDGHVIHDVDAIVACLKRLLYRLDSSCHQVALAVPDAAIISKVVQVRDGLHEDDLEELIALEADKYIAYPLDELNLDFEILGRCASSPSLLDVLIVASRAEHVSRRVDIAKRAGLEVVVVDVESYAVERAVQWFAQDVPELRRKKIIAIIDIGEQGAHLLVLRAMKLIYSREVSCREQPLIEASTGPVYQAMRAQEQETFATDDEQQLFTPFKKNLLGQLKGALHFFYSASPEEEIEHILLAGSLARLPGLVSFMQGQLNIRVTVANPFSSLSLGEQVSVEALTEDAPSLMVACGLALRNIK